jgi:membrane-associated phospholipid phosphatase
LWPVMRECLGEMAEHINRREADAVVRSTVLPADAPAFAVTVLTEVARGGLLWVGIAATLATRPGATRRAARDGVVAVAMVGLLVAPVAVAVAHSRLRTRAHWPSDVVAGALCGVAVGVTTRHLLRLQAVADSIQVAGLSRD